VSIQLTILEKLSDSKPYKIRKRLIAVTADSVTIGNKESCDVELKSFNDPFVLEIKKADETWWLVNPLRRDDLTINNKIASLENTIKNEDKICIEGHTIIFNKPEEPEEIIPDFIDPPKSDQELWDYLISEKEFDEILINGASSIYADWRGVLYLTPWKFKSNGFLSARIKDNAGTESGWGSWRMNRTLRIQTALPPLVEEPHISIRKAKSTVLSMDELLKTGFGTLEEMEFLRKAVKNNESIVISGGTSTGKTVLLRSFIQQVPHSDRLVILEEETETDWPHPHAVVIETGRGNLRPAVVESLRMRPTRLIISEVRGAEAFDLLQAMNTGHEGSMTTIHSNSSREALSRLENLVLSSGVPLTVNAIRRQLSQAIDIIVQLKRDKRGKRSIDHIVRVTGIQNSTILLSDPVGLEAVGIEQSLGLVEK